MLRSSQSPPLGGGAAAYRMSRRGLCWARWRMVLRIGLVGGLCAAGVGGTGSCGAPPAHLWQFPDQCEPGTLPDELCYVAKRDPSSEQVGLARALAERYMAEHPAESLAWDWGPGVLLYALTELHRVTGDPALLDYARTYLDSHLAEGVPLSVIDHCPPALAALSVYEVTGAPEYRAAAQAAVTLVERDALRTEQGGISHLGTQDLFGPTLWIDSLFMFGELLVRWSEVTGQQHHLDELGRQFRIFAALLQTDGGLFLHAYGWPAAPDPDVFWARGNGWVTAAGFDYLRARTLRGEQDEVVQQILGRQAEAVAGTQDATGLWWTVLDRPGETYLETSATALFGYGLARGYRFGALGREVLPVVARAFDGVRSRIRWDAGGRPVVTGISGPTTAGTYAGYASVELEEDLHYGVGAVILFLIEVSGLGLDGVAAAPGGSGQGSLCARWPTAWR